MLHRILNVVKCLRIKAAFFKAYRFESGLQIAYVMNVTWPAVLP